MTTAIETTSQASTDLKSLATDVVRRAHGRRRYGGGVRRPRRRRIFHRGAAGPGRNAEGIGLARHRRARLLRTARGQHAFQRFFRRRYRAHVEVRARTGEDLFRRSARGNSRGRETRIAYGRPRSLSRGCLLAARRRAHRVRAPRRKGRARRRPAHQEFRRRIVRRRHWQKSAGEFSRICRRIPAVVLFGRGGADCAERR